MRYLILILLTFTVFGEDTKPKPQPPEVINALAAYEKGLIEARKEYEAKEAKLRMEAARKLDEAKRAYARREDLEGGVLCQESIKKLGEGEIMKQVEEKWVERKNLIGGLTAEMIVGKWKVENSDKVTVSVVIDNKLNAVMGSGEFIGTVKINGNSFTITWSGGKYIHRDITFDITTKNYIGKDSGKNIVYSKIGN